MHLHHITQTALPALSLSLVMLVLIGCGAQPVAVAPQAEAATPSPTLSSTPLATPVRAVSPNDQAQTIMAVRQTIAAERGVADQRFVESQDVGELAYVRIELQRTDLPPETRQNFEARRARLEESVSQKATALARPTIPGHELTPAPTSSDPTSTPIRGIFEYPDKSAKTPPEYLNLGYRFENAWTDGNSDGTVIVWAGGRQATPEIGVVLIYDVRTGVPGKAVETPTRSGPVRIIAEQSRQLTLQATNGDLFVFDINSRQFLNAPPAATPVVTPTP